MNGQPIKAGDPIKVLNREGSSERHMRGSFWFVALVTNYKGSQWVDVFGGKDTGKSPERKARSFPVDRIEPLPPEKKKRVKKG